MALRIPGRWARIVPRRALVRGTGGRGVSLVRTGAVARLADARRRPRPHAALAARADRHRRTSRGLKVAWTYRTRRRAGRRPLADPVQPDRGATACSTPRRAQLKAFALDAATGRELWRFDPFAAGAEDERARREPRRRRSGATATSGASSTAPDSTSIALDAAHRQADPGFGDERPRRPARGARPRRRRPLRALDDARRRLPRPADPRHARARGPGPVGARARPRLRRAHRRHPLDVPHDPAARASPATTPGPRTRGRRVGGANAWSGISVDERARPRLPADRLAGVRLLGRRPPRREPLRATACSRCKAATGERVWHYQLVHHDLWDRDLPQAPVLVTVHARRAAAWTPSRRPRSRGTCSCSTARRASRSSRSRSGRSRRPTSTARRPGRRSRSRSSRRRSRASGSPRPTLTDRTPAAHAAVLERFRPVRSGGAVRAAEHAGHGDLPRLRRRRASGAAPPSTRETRLLYVNANEMPWILDDGAADEDRTSGAARRARLRRSTARSATAPNARATRRASSRPLPRSRRSSTRADVARAHRSTARASCRRSACSRGGADDAVAFARPRRRRSPAPERPRTTHGRRRPLHPHRLQPLPRSRRATRR